MRMLNNILEEKAPLDKIWQDSTKYKAAGSTQKLLAMVFEVPSIQDLKEMAPVCLADETEHFNIYFGCGVLCKKNRKKHIKALKDIHSRLERIQWVNEFVSSDLGFLATMINMEIDKAKQGNDDPEVLVRECGAVD